MKFANLLSLLLLITLALACSHTNNLSQYDLNNKNIFFKQIEEPNAKEVKVQFHDEPISGGSGAAQIDAVADAGSAVISTGVEKRFMQGVNSDKALDDIVIGIQESINKVYDVKIENSVNDLTDYIVETKLTDCKLIASNLGINILVEASSIILDKKKNEIIWEYTGSSTVGIVKINNIMRDQERNSATTVLNTTDLEKLTDEQIQKSVYSAVQNVKEDITAALREDLVGTEK